MPSGPSVQTPDEEEDEEDDVFLQDDEGAVSTVQLISGVIFIPLDSLDAETERRLEASTATPTSRQNLFANDTTSQFRPPSHNPSNGSRAPPPREAPSPANDDYAAEAFDVAPVSTRVTSARAASATPRAIAPPPAPAPELEETAADDYGDDFEEAGAAPPVRAGQVDAIVGGTSDQGPAQVVAVIGGGSPAVDGASAQQPPPPIMPPVGGAETIRALHHPAPAQAVETVHYDEGPITTTTVPSLAAPAHQEVEMVPSDEEFHSRRFSRSFSCSRLLCGLNPGTIIITIPETRRGYHPTDFITPSSSSPSIPETRRGYHLTDFITPSSSPRVPDTRRGYHPITPSPFPRLTITHGPSSPRITTTAPSECPS
ncbi:hypothetical protein PAPYR_11512 [Paratrimastix pyriformis]|uniref:Uncharacterized protein n=1 Tax=Paratrimastix pyriformis TaxID=342808 RepID=A0ABQ8U5C6_9EUKA|nr:hypothetical protein PAPYR_11512 [Paratrimastix pyriformis]